MADNTDIPLKITIDGVDKEINSLKDLKQARKDLQSAFIQGDADAAKSLGVLNEKLQDLKKTTSSVQGSGVEKLTSSFGVLKEGLAGFDLTKIKIGFQGLGAAMSALPIFLLVQGIQLLIENFDVVIDVAKGFLGITNDNEDAAKRLIVQIEAEADAFNKLQTAQESSTKSRILQAQALGASEKELDDIRAQGYLTAIKRSQDYVNQATDEYNTLLKNNSASAEDIKKAGQIQLDAQTQLKKAKDTSADFNLQRQINLNKSLDDEEQKLTAKYKEELAKRKAAQAEHDKEVNADFAASLADEQAQLASDAKQTNDTQAQRDANTLAGQKLLIQQQADLNSQAAQEAQQSAERDKAFQLKNAQEIADAKVFIEREGFAGAQALSDVYFSTQLNAAKGNQAALTEIAKKQFNVNKALQIAQAVIDGFRAVTTNIAAFPAPYGEIAGVIAGIAAAANIAKIASTQFNPQSSAASGGSSASLPSAPPPPQLLGPNSVQSTNLPRPQDRAMPVAQVVETQLTSTVNRVARIKNQASF